MALSAEILATPAAAFLAPPSLRPSGSVPVGAEGVQHAQQQPKGIASGLTSSVLSAACALAVAAGVSKVRRRRVAGRAEKSATSALGKAALCGATAVRPADPPAQMEGRTTAHYTAQKVLPDFQWVKAGVTKADIEPGQLKARYLSGLDVLVGKTQTGTLFCVGNLCPHLGTPMSEGADVIGDTIICPLHGSSWSTATGELIDWCPSPPIIGPLTGMIVDKKNLPVIEARTGFFSDDIEVLVDTNARKAYEADYWKGLLDAQGKEDGTFY